MSCGEVFLILSYSWVDGGGNVHSGLGQTVRSASHRWRREGRHPTLNVFLCLRVAKRRRNSHVCKPTVTLWMSVINLLSRLHWAPHFIYFYCILHLICCSTLYNIFGHCGNFLMTLPCEFVNNYCHPNLLLLHLLLAYFASYFFVLIYYHGWLKFGWKPLSDSNSNIVNM